jgi:D-alanyl-D-alanine carboxypeptidase
MPLVVSSVCGLANAAEKPATPPATTSHAWAIAEGSTGKIIASKNGDEPVKSASTTKVMCALVVLELAKQDPAVLDEVVTFSKLADDTEGSTCDIKVGEKIHVRDGLYAMLLPSGNDMGNAFAEHFNKRLAPPGDETPKSVSVEKYGTRRNFIAEMNRMAARLGLAKTHYRLPYGDGGTAADRTTTAKDLIHLGREAMKNPLFQTLVKTVKYTAQITTPDGSTREGTWENTNKLLKLGTYDGIKTGQTKTAGNCLLATGVHEGRRLYVVVLGAATEADRFTDTQNLFQWALEKPVELDASKPKSK